LTRGLQRIAHLLIPLDYHSNTTPPRRCSSSSLHISFSLPLLPTYYHSSSVSLTLRTPGKDPPLTTSGVPRDPTENNTFWFFIPPPNHPIEHTKHELRKKISGFLEKKIFVLRSGNAFRKFFFSKTDEKNLKKSPLFFWGSQYLLEYIGYQCREK